MTSPAKPPPSGRRRRTSRAAEPPPRDPVAEYAHGVDAGLVLAGPWVRLACARHLRDLQEAHRRSLRWDLPKALRAIGFFRDVLRLNGGEHEGRRFELEPWQAFIIGSLFGWVRADTGYRRFRTAYIEAAKGSGKSPLCAGAGLYCMVADDEPRAEVYSAASKKDQAMILFRDAVAMVDQSPDLHSAIVKTGGINPWNLSYPVTGSFFRAISSDDGQSGPRPHCSLIDEIHEHTDGTVVNMLGLGQKGRRQPLTIEITNSGFDKTSICYQHHEYSTRVVQARTPDDESFDDEWFAYVCALDDGDDPFLDEACWPKANPNIGVTIPIEYLRKQVREARGMPAKASIVKRLNFCMWVDAENPWIDGPLWLACQDRETPREDALLELAKCYRVAGALDLSGARDLTALALAGETDTETLLYCELFTPKDTLEERAKTDRVPYDAWVDAGYLTATPGRSVDYRFVAQRMVEIQTEAPQFGAAAFDPYRIKYLERDLDEINAQFTLVSHPQGYFKPQERDQKTLKPGETLPPVLWMPRSIELLTAAIFARSPEVIAAREIERGEEESRGEAVAAPVQPAPPVKPLRVLWNPCLNWCSASAVLEADPKNNNIFSKRKSRGRIDGIVASAMAIGLLLDGVPQKAPPPKFKMVII